MAVSAPAAMPGFSFGSAINGIVLICAGPGYLKTFLGPRTSPVL